MAISRAAKSTRTTSAATRATRSKQSTGNVTMMLCYTVIITIIASLVLSVDAIRCHQCNSHLQEDCLALRLNIPRAPIDEQYLKDCEVADANVAFCRKTTVTILATGEHRIVRSCGWINTDSVHNNTCFDADNDGYMQTICTCYEDGCNSAPTLGTNGLIATMCVGLLCLIFASWFRRRA